MTHRGWRGFTRGHRRALVERLTGRFPAPVNGADRGMTVVLHRDRVHGGGAAVTPHGPTHPASSTGPIGKDGFAAPNPYGVSSMGGLCERITLRLGICGWRTARRRCGGACRPAPDRPARPRSTPGRRSRRYLPARHPGALRALLMPARSRVFWKRSAASGISKLVIFVARSICFPVTSNRSGPTRRTVNARSSRSSSE